MKIGYIAFIATSTSIFFTLGTIIYYVSIAITIPLSITLLPDFPLSKNCLSEINNVIPELNQLPFHAHDIANLLSAAAPGLQGVSIRRKGFRELELYLHIAKPIARLSEITVLLEDGTVTYSNLYLNDILQDLPTIMADTIPPSSCVKELVHFIKNIDKKVLNTYEIHWINKTLINLYHKEAQGFEVVSAAFTVINEPLFAKLESLQKKISNRCLKKRVWRADIRFRDYIVLSPLRGDHEKNI